MNVGRDKTHPPDASHAPSSVVKPARFRNIVVYALYCVLATYLLLELLYSTLYYTRIIAPSERPSFWIIEDTGGTVEFDPIRGYRLNATPSRHAQITLGTLEYVSVLRGNSQGFPDRDDFSPARSDPDRVRIAVLGDSFTAAQYLGVNWPDKVEDLAQEAGIDLELLNFSLDGGGIVNWWSILTRLIEAERYQLDGILYAVFDWDFDRSFFIADHRAHRWPWCNYLPWESPDTWPTTLDQALPLMDPMPNTYMVGTDVFDQALAGEWQPGTPQTWRPLIAIKIKETIGNAAARLWSFVRSRQVVEAAPTDPPVNEEFQPGVADMVDDMASYSRSRSLPVLVVRIPSKDAIIHGAPPQPTTLEFAYQTCATFADGSEAFAGMTEDGLRGDWLPYDGHWGQRGSDRFASFMLGVLEEWMRNPSTDTGADTNGRLGRWRQVAGRYPDAAYAQYYLSRALEDAGQTEAAIEAATKATTRQGQSVWKYCRHLAELLDQAGRPDEAVDAYLRAAALAPRDIDILNDLGLTLMNRDHTDAALGVFSDAIAIDPEYWLPYSTLDREFARRDDPDGRIALWRNMAAEHPEAARPRFHLGLAFRSVGDLEAAVAWLDKGAALNASSAEILGHLSSTLAAKGDLEQAIEIGRQAIALDASFATMVADSLGDAAGRSRAEGHLDKAVVAYRAAIAVAPDKGKSLYPELVATLHANKDYDGAAEAAEACRGLGADLPRTLSEEPISGSGTGGPD